MHDQFLPYPIEANRDRFAKTKKFQITYMLHLPNQENMKLQFCLAFKANIIYKNLFLL